MPPDSCAHCGTPLRRRQELYCCLGCAVLAAALKGGTGKTTSAARPLILRLGLAAFFSADVMVLSLFLYSLETPAPPGAMALVRMLLVAFSTPVFVLLAPPFLAGLVRDLRRLRFSMDSLIALGAGAAFVFSCVAVARGSNVVYFDTATMVLLLVTVGRLLEARARDNGRKALAGLLNLEPPRALVLREGEWQSVDASSVVPGEQVRVAAGERVPVDGAIVTGAASLDVSMITGEPLPAERNETDAVFAGSLCLNGALVVRCTSDSQDSLAARIARSVEQALLARSPLEKLADRTAAVFVPFTVALAAIVAIHSGAWLIGLSVLVVACPCALGIAAPLVNVLVLATAAHRGILVRSTEALERLAGIDTLVLDKTGTVTRGSIQVTRIIPAAGHTPQQVLTMAAAAAQSSSHPVARAIGQLAESSGITFSEARRIDVLPGRGVIADTVDGRRVLLGQARWIESQIDGVPPRLEGATWCAEDGRLAGAFVLDDPVSDDAIQAVGACRGLGLKTVLLSGDGCAAVSEAAARLGINDAQGELLPEDKAARIQEFRSMGRHVAMAGDGINDAPALAAADVGIAVSNGTDVAREVAEVVLIEGGLWKLPELIRLARRARGIIRQNLAWTFGYNALALTLAATGRLRPVWAAALMLVSSVAVISNSFRIRGSFTAHCPPPTAHYPPSA